MKNLAERFLKAREHAKLTQAQVAEEAGILQQSVTKIEKGIIKNPKEVDKYAHVLKVSPQWLMFGDPKDAPLWALKEENKIPDSYLPILEWDEIEEFIENGRKNLDMSEEGRNFIASPLIENFQNRKIFAVRVKNDAMVSISGSVTSFCPESILIAEPREKCAPNNYVIVKKKKEKEPFFRQIIKEGDNLFIKPINPQYPLLRLDNDYLILAVAFAKLDLLI